MKVQGAVLGKFVIIDPSISGDGGHYLEYALRVLKAAGREGWSLVLGVNKTFDVTIDRKLSIDVEPIFTYDIWGRDLSASAKEIAPATDDERRQMRRLFSRSGLLWQLAAHPDVARIYLGETGLPERIAKRLTRLVPVYTAAQERQSRRRAVAGEAGFADEMASLRRDISALLGDPSQMEKDRLSTTRSLESIERAATIARDFADRLEEMHDRHDLGEGDIVFIPTMAWPDLTGFVEFLSRREGKPKPIYAPLFRRNIFNCYPRDYTEQGYSVHPYRRAFAALQTVADGSVRVCTDTEPLTEQYRQVTDVPLATLPIPCPKTRMARRKADDKKPVSLVYLGDARAEKGFDSLPMIAKSIRDGDLKGKFSIRTQLYFPPKSSDMQMIQAGEQLRRYDDDIVSIVEGSLNSEAYVSEIEKAGAILIAYDRQNYAARSSGIFMEAAAAGVPVIATAGTWMSGLIGEATWEYHHESIENSEIISVARSGALDWRQIAGNDDTAAEHSEDDAVQLRPDVTTYIAPSVPRQATHLWLTFEGGAGSSGCHTSIQLTERDHNLKTLHERTYTLGGSQNGKQSLVIPVERLAQSFWIGFQNLYTRAPFELSGLRLCWLRREAPIARCAGAVTTQLYSPHRYSDMINNALPELHANYDEIARSAAHLAKAYAREHSAETLVDRLITAARKSDHEPPRELRAFQW